MQMMDSDDDKNNFFEKHAVTTAQRQIPDLSGYARKRRKSMNKSNAQNVQISF